MQRFVKIGGHETNLTKIRLIFTNLALAIKSFNFCNAALLGKDYKFQTDPAPQGTELITIGLLLKH